jgi:hypothetical protein
VVYDGPFEQVSGKVVDADLLRRLEAEHASIPRAIDALGLPAERKDAGDRTILVYKSVRRRVSKENVAGVPASQSAQQFTQAWELEFDNGALARTRASSNIADY